MEQEGSLNAESRADLGRCLLYRGMLLVRIGQRASARESFEQVREQLKPIARDHDREKYWSALGRTDFELGALFLFDNRLPQANQFFDNARRVFRDLSARYPKNLDYKSDWAAAINAVGPPITGPGK